LPSLSTFTSIGPRRARPCVSRAHRCDTAGNAVGSVSARVSFATAVAMRSIDPSAILLPRADAAIWAACQPSPSTWSDRPAIHRPISRPRANAHLQRATIGGAKRLGILASRLAFNHRDRSVSFMMAVFIDPEYADRHADFRCASHCHCFCNK